MKEKSEVPSFDEIYYLISFEDESFNKKERISIGTKLIEISKKLNFKTSIGSDYKDLRLAHSLKNTDILNFNDSVFTDHLIDCIWIKNDSSIPAIIEIVNPKNIIRSLTKFKLFKEKSPLLFTRYSIVAPNWSRDKVLKEARKPEFKDLNTKYFSYSSVEELYYLCKRRKIEGVTEEFLDCFMEPILE